MLILTSHYHYISASVYHFHFSMFNQVSKHTGGKKNTKNLFKTLQLFDSNKDVNYVLTNFSIYKPHLQNHISRQKHTYIIIY